jgi:formate dehydrogenase subunit gamma
MPMSRQPWSEAQAREIIAQHAALEGAALPMLHGLQRAFGYVPPDAVPLIAEALNLSRAEVHGIVSFYHDFRSEPAQRPVVKLCKAEACQARGGSALAAQMLDRHGDAVQFEPTFCLGLCASGPAALVDGAPYARLTPERLDEILETVA